MEPSIFINRGEDESLIGHLVVGIKGRSLRVRECLGESVKWRSI